MLIHRDGTGVNSKNSPKNVLESSTENFSFDNFFPISSNKWDSCIQIYGSSGSKLIQRVILRTHVFG